MPLAFPPQHVTTKDVSRYCQIYIRGYMLVDFFFFLGTGYKIDTLCLFCNVWLLLSENHCSPACSPDANKTQSQVAIAKRRKTLHSWARTIHHITQPLTTAPSSLDHLYCLMAKPLTQPISAVWQLPRGFSPPSIHTLCSALPYESG